MAQIQSSVLKEISILPQNNPKNRKPKVLRFEIQITKFWEPKTNMVQNVDFIARVACFC